MTFISQILHKFLSNKKSLVHIIQYRDQYIIETIHSSDTGTWLRSEHISKVALDISLQDLGELINTHLDKSVKVIYEQYDLKSVNEKYAKIIKKKTIKSQMENAKLVSILREGELLVLAPYKNGGTKGKSKGYTQLSDKQITLNTKDMEEVAKTC